MEETDGVGALHSMTRIVNIGEIYETRPGQVSSLWFEDIESVSKMFTCNEHRVSKIEPAPTNTSVVKSSSVG